MWRWTCLIFGVICFLSVPSHLSGQIERDSFELNFNPEEVLGISKDSLDLGALDLGTCTKIRIVYPIIFGSFSNRTVRVQECFFNAARDVKIVIVTYYEKRSGIVWPIAFVYARAGIPDRHGKRKYPEVWGVYDIGFVESGRITRIWQTIFPLPKETIQDQLTDVLLKGFRSADLEQ